MLLTVRMVLGLIAAVISGYMLVTNNFEFQSLMLFFLSLMMLVMGLDEFKKGRKGYGWMGIITFLFVFPISLYVYFN